MFERGLLTPPIASVLWSESYCLNTRQVREHRDSGVGRWPTGLTFSRQGSNFWPLAVAPEDDATHFPVGQYQDGDELRMSEPRNG